MYAIPWTKGTVIKRQLENFRSKLHTREASRGRARVQTQTRLDCPAQAPTVGIHRFTTYDVHHTISYQLLYCIKEKEALWPSRQVSGRIFYFCRCVHAKRKA